MNIARMVRGACFLALVAAALSLSAAPPKEAARQPANNAKQQVKAAPQQAAAPVKQLQNAGQHDKPCGKGDENRASDLCAQWKAADSAKSAAEAAWWIGGIGALIGLLTLAVAVGAALYARDAAKAARDALQHERHRSAAELRPWVKIDVNVTKFAADDSGFDITYEIIFTNIGQTVAEGFTFETNSTFFKLDTEYINGEYAKREEPKKMARLALMPGDERRGGGSHSTMKRTLPWHVTKTRKSVSFVVIATAFYRSAMDEKWHRTDRSFLVGRDDPNLNRGYFLYEEMVGDGTDLVTVRQFTAGETT